MIPKKTRCQSVPIAALCLYDIQRENLGFQKSLEFTKMISPGKVGRHYLL